MTTHHSEISFVDEVLHTYDSKTTKLLAFFTVLVLTTGTALVLDRGFGIPQASVLLYVAGLITFFLIIVPMLVVGVRRSWETFASDDLNHEPGWFELLGASMGMIAGTLLMGISDHLKDPRTIDAVIQLSIQSATQNVTQIRLLVRKMDGAMISPEVKLIATVVLNALWKENEECVRALSRKSEGTATGEYHRGVNQATKAIIEQIESVISKEQPDPSSKDSSVGQMTWHGGARFYRKHD